MTKLADLVGDRIKLLGYTSPADFERRHGYTAKTVQHIVTGKTARPTQMILNRLAVNLKMIPAELHQAAGFTAETECASAFGLDLGTQEQIIKRLRLAKGAEPERSSFPLGLMHDRGFIDFDELRAGLRYGLLHQLAFGRSTARSAMGNLVANDSPDGEPVKQRRPMTDEEKHLMDGILEREAQEMVVALDPLYRDYLDPLIIEDKFPAWLLRDEDWNVPRKDLGGKSFAEWLGRDEVEDLLQEADKFEEKGVTADPGAAALATIIKALKHLVKVAERFHVERLSLYEVLNEEAEHDGRNRHAGGSL